MIRGAVLASEPTFGLSVLRQRLDKALRQLAPVQPAVQMVLNVVAIVEGPLVV